MKIRGEVRKMKKHSLIYKPLGRAGEYAEYALDIYDGCNFGCTYCFNKPKPVPVVRKGFSLDRLEKECEKFAEEHKGEVTKVLLCFSSDPYNSLAMSTGLTRKVLIMLHKYGINFKVLTKNPIAAINDFDLYGHNDEFAVTLSFSNTDKLREYEKDSTSVEDRLYGLKKAKERGIYTWVSVEPVIDTKEALGVIEKASKYTDLFKIGKINHDEELEKSIDWGVFGFKAVEKCNRLGNKYYIKKDLRDEMYGKKD